MNNSRRKFLHKASLSVGAIALGNYAISSDEINAAEIIKPDSFNAEHDFWEWVRQSYTVSSNVINLNNGGVSPQPKVVQEVFEQYNRLSNEAPSYYMWRVLDKGRESIRRNLADLAGCLPDEIAIQRNSSESLETIIFGLNLEKGDEVIVTNYDYPNMRNAWKQREKRDGIKLVWISIPVGDVADEEIVKLYENAITSKTKIIHITHVINWTGRILPAKKIAQLAHTKNIEVVLDAAHSFAHIPCNFHDLECDYAGTSLHKWLCAPFGTGLLFVKQEKISNLWPAFSPEDPTSGDIKKYEALGTRSFPAEMAIGKAISFHNSIGTERKTERLNFLKKYWTDQVKSLSKIKFYTPLENNSCAIATVGIEGKEANEIESYLFENYGIHTVSIIWEDVNGIRVTPHVYTSLSELDLLVKGLTELASK